MKSRQAPRRNTASSLSSALLALVLGAWIIPAPAATGTGASCDQPLDAAPMSLADDGKLTLQVIDRGTATTTATDDISLDDSGSDSAPIAAGGSKGPQVDIILQRIFEEAEARQPNLAEPEQARDLSAPLAVDKTESADEPSHVLRADPAAAPAEVSGFSSDELLRYRQQMYRTDI